MYNFKGDKQLFDEWTKVSKKTSKKITAMNIIQQDDMEATSDELKEWYETSIEEIRKVDKEFRDIIGEMISLRERTMEHIRNQVKGQK